MQFLGGYSEAPIGTITDYVRQWYRFQYQPAFLYKKYLISELIKKALKNYFGLFPILAKSRFLQDLIINKLSKGVFG